MATVADLISRTRQYLQGGHPERRNLLATALTDTTTTSVVLTYDTQGIGPNSRVSIGLEDFHVHVNDAGAKTLTVSRGDYGSTATTHSAGDVVLVGSLYSNNAILDAFNDTLLDLEGRGLYKVATPLELTYASGTDGYDLTGVTSLLSVIEVESKAYGRTDWHRLDVGDWRVVHSAETDDFASGFALILSTSEIAYNGNQLRVWYREPFTALTALDDNSTDSGLDIGAEDLLVLGAAVRLAFTAPLLRNDLTFQPDPRRAAEVPPGVTLAAPSNLRRLYEQRVDAELARLDARYPVRLRVK